MRARLVIALATSISLLHMKKYRRSLTLFLAKVLLVKLVIDLLTSLYTVNVPQDQTDKANDADGCDKLPGNSNIPCDELNEIAIQYILRLRGTH